MIGPSDEPEARMRRSAGGPVRMPAVAGSFYPREADACSVLAQSYLNADESASMRQWRGAVVPHAGWICSGAIAGRAIATVARTTSPQVVVIFGAIHTGLEADLAALDSHQRWWTPGREAPVATELRRRLAESGGSYAVDDRFHLREHAVEVELPLIESAWPQVQVVPVEVPAVEQAVEIGRQAARAVEAAGVEAVFLASSDLTHYGPNYGFAPAGVGAAGLEWAKANDRRLLELILAAKAEAVVPEVRRRLNACGGGAIAAMLAACRELGAGEARLLWHANSYETLAAVAEQRPDNAVGYAAVVVG